MHQKNTDETLVTNLCNIGVQPLQQIQHLDLFCNIHPKQLHTSETFETLETYVCNMLFQQNMAAIHIVEKELCHLKRGSYICLLSESNDSNLLDELLNDFIWFLMF
jgi:hypothetical protein